jgi:hypothetical protein
MATGITFIQKKLSKIGTPEFEHELMRKEIELLRQLTSLACPYVVRYVDDDEDVDAISLYTEYFEKSLFELIQKKKQQGKAFSDLKICEYITQIAQGWAFEIAFSLFFFCFLRFDFSFPFSFFLFYPLESFDFLTIHFKDWIICTTCLQQSCTKTSTVIASLLRVKGRKRQ